MTVFPKNPNVKIKCLLKLYIFSFLKTFNFHIMFIMSVSLVGSRPITQLLYILFLDSFM